MTKSATELLKADHEKVRKLLVELAQTTDRAPKKRTDLLDKIEKELEVHTQIEEEIFYPAFKTANGSGHDKMYYEAREEHRAVKKLVLPDLRNTNPEGHEFAGRAKVLKELVEHHAEEEEEEMFREAESALSSRELAELGDRMMARKKELMVG